MGMWNTTLKKFTSNNDRLFEGTFNVLNGSAGHIPLAAGQIHGFTTVNKFGYSDSIANLSTIWDGSNIYTYSTSAGVVTVSGTTDDDEAIIEVQGLDANYNLITQNAQLNGDGNATFATNMIRIFRARVKEPAPGETTNAGILNISIAGQLRAKILAGNGQTLMALYTIPAGKTGYLLNLTMSVDKNVDVIYKLISIEPIDGRVANLKGQFGTFGTPIDHNYPIPLKFAEKTDIEVRADAGNACGGGATFDLILVDNN